METFRHIREQHLTEIKHLNIKIGKPPTEETKKKSKRKPGPRSKTMKHLSPLPFFLYSASDSQNETKSEESEIKPDDPDMDLESAISSISELSSHIHDEAEKILEEDKELKSEDEPMDVDDDDPSRVSVDSSSKSSSHNDRDSNTPQSNNDSSMSEHELVLSKNETKVTLKASFEISDEMDIGDAIARNSEPKNSLLEIDPNRDQMDAIDVYLFEESGEDE